MSPIRVRLPQWHRLGPPSTASPDTGIFQSRPNTLSFGGSGNEGWLRLCDMSWMGDFGGSSAVDQTYANQQAAYVELFLARRMDHSSGGTANYASLLTGMRNQRENATPAKNPLIMLAYGIGGVDWTGDPDDASNDPNPALYFYPTATTPPSGSRNLRSFVTVDVGSPSHIMRVDTTGYSDYLAVTYGGFSPYDGIIPDVCGDFPTTSHVNNITSNISTSTWVAGTQTHNTFSAHNLLTDYAVRIAGSSVAGYNGDFIVVSTPTSTQFTVAKAGSGTAGTGGTATNPTPWNFDTSSAASWYSGTRWQTLIGGMLNRLQVSLGCPVCPNGLQDGPNYFGSDASSILLDYGDGAMAESFLRSSSAAPTVSTISETAWRQNVDMLIDGETRNKPIFCCTKLWPGSTSATQAQAKAWFKYSLATFMLGSSGRHFMQFRMDNPNDAFVAATDGATYADSATRDDMKGRHHWHPDNFFGSSDKWLDRIKVGVPLSSPVSAASLKGAAPAGGSGNANVYLRQSSNGIILVNPTASSGSVTLPAGTWQDVDGTNYTGSLTVFTKTAYILSKV